MAGSMNPDPQNPPEDDDKLRRVRQNQQLGNLQKIQKEELLELVQKHQQEQQELLRLCRELSIDDLDSSTNTLPQVLLNTPPFTSRQASRPSPKPSRSSITSTKNRKFEPVHTQLNHSQIECIDLTNDEIDLASEADDVPLTSTHNKYALARTAASHPTSSKDSGLWYKPSSTSHKNEVISSGTNTNPLRLADPTVQRFGSPTNSSTELNPFKADYSTTRSNIQVKALEEICATRKARSSQHRRSRGSTATQASPRPKRPQFLQPDINPEIPVNTVCKQQIDRSSTFKPQTVLPRDRTLLLLEGQKRDGGFVGRSGRSQSFVPELYNLAPSTREPQGQACQEASASKVAKGPTVGEEKQMPSRTSCTPNSIPKTVERSDSPQMCTHPSSVPAVEPKTSQTTKSFKVPPLPTIPRSGGLFSNVAPARSTREESIISHVSTSSAFSLRSSTGRKRKEREVILSDGELDYRPSPPSSPTPEPRRQRSGFAKPELPATRTKVVNKYGFLEPVNHDPESPRTPPSKIARTATPSTPSKPVRPVSARPRAAGGPRSGFYSSGSPMRPKRLAGQNAKMRIKRYIHEEAQYEKTPETKRMQQHEEERGAGLRASLLESPSKGPTVKAGATPQETSVIRGPTSFREATTETFYTAKGWVGEKLGGDRYLSKERNLDDEGSENGGIEEDKRREELAKQLDMGMDEGMDEGCEY